MPIKDLFKDVPDKRREGNAVTAKDDKSEINPMDIDELQFQETNVSQRYPALNTISGIYITLAVVVIIITAVISMVELVMGLDFLGISGGIGTIIFVLVTIAIGSIIALSLFAASESIKVFMDIEANTRKSAEITNMVSRDEK